jgi:hypothetical protein
MIRDDNIDQEHIGDRTKQPRGLTERLVKHRARREAGLDGDRRRGWLTPRSAVAGTRHASPASYSGVTAWVPRQEGRSERPLRHLSRASNSTPDRGARGGLPCRHILRSIRVPTR